MARLATWSGIFLALAVLHARAAEDESVRVRHLTLTGIAKISSLSLQPIIRDIKSREYQLANLEEIAEQIRLAFQHYGYFEVSVGAPEVTHLAQGRSPHRLDLKIPVKQGERYRLKTIRFSPSSAFASPILRRQLLISDGEIFDREKIALGLENLRRLYRSTGHLYFSALPNIQIDESSQEISLSIDLDEGPVWRLGKLIVEGEESQPGAREKLLNGWKPYEGEVYDPGLFRKFLGDLHARPNVTPEQVFRFFQDDQLRIVDVQIKLVKPTPF